MDRNDTWDVVFTADRTLALYRAGATSSNEQGNRLRAWLQQELAQDTARKEAQMRANGAPPTAR